MSGLQTEMPPLPWYGWAGLAALVLAQGIWLFVDARKRGSFPWFWGVWGLISFPLPSLLYLIFVRKVFRSRSRKS